MKKAEYDETLIFDVLRDINEFAVSLVHIANVHHELGEKAWKEGMLD